MITEQQILHACYRNFNPHIERYVAEQSLEKRLPMMEPGILVDFAEQACRDLVRLFRDAIALEEDELYERLSACLSGFASHLNRFAAELHQYHALAGQSWNAAVGAAIDGGDYFSQVGGALFGGWGRVIGGGLGAFFTGRAVEKRMEPADERIQLSFQALGESYGNAMQAMVDTAIELTEAA